MNDYHLALLTPFDTLFFRDHRPFNAGEYRYSEPLFPTPLTFMGALGGAYMEQQNVGRHAFINGTADPFLGAFDNELMDQDSGLRIKGLFLVKDATLYLPMPANFLLRKANAEEYDISLIYPTAENEMELPKADFEYNRGYITGDDFTRTCRQEKARKHAIPHRYHLGPLCDELRVGIGIDPQTNSVDEKERLLYFTSHYRPTDSNVSFAVLYQTANREALPHRGSLRLGGESRLVYTGPDQRLVEVRENLSRLLETTRSRLQEAWGDKAPFRFAVYLLTPAIFDDGWKPGEWPWGDSATLWGACVPKPDWVSGFRITQGRSGEPRRLHRAAPAGSVYFFESSDGGLKKELLDNYMCNKRISNTYPKAGIGLTLIRPWWPG